MTEKQREALWRMFDSRVFVGSPDELVSALRENGFELCTPAERKVLDACAELSTDSLEAFGKPASTPWVAFAHAELARRNQ